MKSNYFHSVQFTATQWESAEQKAKFANQFIDFILSGYKATKFPKWFYNRLSMCFGFIAHYNRGGFYDTYFTNDSNVHNFLNSIIDFNCCGDPEFTYSDVEKELRLWVIGKTSIDMWQIDK